jgi:imidazolonepropionase-like amidohydrolase
LAAKERASAAHSDRPLGQLKKEMAFERAFVAAGGLLMAGCDPTGNGGALPGFGDQRNLELLVEAGFTPLEAIKIYSYNAAQYLGQSSQVGSIAVGAKADLVVVQGDPSQKIEDVERVEYVFKDGAAYDPGKLLNSVRGSLGVQ